MKVPTYEARQQAPRQGQGRFLTAQLSPSAMIAPSRAAADQAQQLARTGDKIAEFGFKKLEAGAKQEAFEEVSNYGVELATAEGNFLQSNVSTAEQEYKKESQRLYKKYASKLKNSYARSSFASNAIKLQSQSTINFVRKNNARVIAQAETNISNDLNSNLKIATNPNNKMQLRREALAENFFILQEAKNTLGPEKHKTFADTMYMSLANDTLSFFINIKPENAEEIVDNFRENKSTDDILQAARNNLSETEVSKIATNIEKIIRSNRERENDIEQRQQDEEKDKDRKLFREYLFGDKPESKKTEIFNQLKMSTFVSVSELKLARKFVMSGGSQGSFNNTQDVFVLSQAIINEEITNTDQIIKRIDDDKLNVNYQTLRTVLYPLIEATKDKNFKNALTWGLSTIGFTESVAASGTLDIGFKIDKATKFKAEMLDWQFAQKKKKTRDKVYLSAMTKAKAVIDNLSNMVDPDAELLIFRLATRLKKANKGGDSTKIATSKEALITTLIQYGRVTASEALAPDYNPLKRLGK